MGSSEQSRGRAGWRLIRRLLSAAWEGLSYLSLVHQPDLMILRAVANAEAREQAKAAEAAGSDQPGPWMLAEPPAGHPERLTTYLPSSAERELWRQLDNLVG